jgi:hypothetical protein
MAIGGLNKLCTPSYVYFVLSMIFILVALFQNYGNTYVYCLGSQSCDVSSTALIFLMKFIYVLFWTWILNLICQANAPMLAWFLVFIPFILLFILIGMMMLY